MKPQDYFDREAERLKVEYEAGVLGSLAEAVFLFSENHQPLPKWAAEAVLAHLGAIYEKGLGARRGRGGGYRAVSQDIHVQRWTIIDNLLRLQRVKTGKTNLAQAARDASERLKNSPAQGMPRQIVASYRKVAAEGGAKESV